MSDIKIFPSSKKVDANALLQAATGANLKDVVIIGWDPDDNLFVSGTMAPNSIEMIGSIEIAKDALLHEYSER
ncbi:MAG: hypothetical protein CMI54_04690 [Parcubacteria group bacterium]|nr:hypothetical protein [Parcubacteria group bacterium]|tara:strand:+ start:2224 stop:2442 length:219 start_codon:yes stop_codon:yes gene_type:complete